MMTSESAALFDVSPPRYSIDTNVVVSFLHTSGDEVYGSGMFVQQWQFIERLMRGGLIVGTREVEAELKKWCGVITTMKDWLRAFAFIFLDPDDKQLRSAKRIVNAFPVYGRSGNDLTDMTVMALADSLGIAALSMENTKQTSGPKRPKIPSVCRDLGIDFATVPTLLLREGFGATGR